MEANASPTGPIGVFDSGVGGLSVWRELAQVLPAENFLYLADQAHVPYGSRPPAELARYSEAIARYLLRRRCKAIVVACNTASASALKALREVFPERVIIGMEPAVKPAAALTRRGVIGILATPGTLDGRLFQATVKRHAEGLRLITQTCEGLAARIEAGDLDDTAMRAELLVHLEPILAAQADVVVLACTHYPFVRETIQTLTGPHCHLVDPAPAIARYLAQCLSAQALLTPEGGPGHTTFCTTGSTTRFGQSLRRLVGVTATPHAAHWQSDDTIVDGATAFVADAATHFT